MSIKRRNLWPAFLNAVYRFEAWKKQLSHIQLFQFEGISLFTDKALFRAGDKNAAAFNYSEYNVKEIVRF